MTFETLKLYKINEWNKKTLFYTRDITVAKDWVKLHLYDNWNIEEFNIFDSIESYKKHRDTVRKRAIAKLTAEELKVLGIKL